MNRVVGKLRSKRMITESIFKPSVQKEIKNVKDAESLKKLSTYNFLNIIMMQS